MTFPHENEESSVDDSAELAEEERVYEAAEDANPDDDYHGNRDHAVGGGQGTADGQ
ncbi:hypothetical protein [Williamsia sterculiae]|uniref:Uncharacterized protein n=1 Tax=Williamsia sterculiae TaxID=1344003 RepID=A0A1N7FLU5_9NOCA|nr:hypothetical protein [Williamsia sterculiae]SIS01237.1 hypothetical protein SAMN05445060_2181 [Williamsia sterculiae]